MAKKNSYSARRAWSLLRISLIWARKGWILRKRLTEELRSFARKYLKAVGHNRDKICYGERELSFDKTPIFHVKMNRLSSMRFMIPCIKPHIDFDYDFDHDDDQDDGVFYGYDNGFPESGDGFMKEEDGIDAKAEAFIAKFYDQIKLQRQISYLQYKGSQMSKE